MKARGKGKVFHINGGGLNKVNSFKMILANVSEGVPVVPFKPLKIAEHPRAAEMRAYAAIPSRYA